MTWRRGCEIAGALAIGGGAALILYAVNDTMIMLARAYHEAHFDLGLAMTFVGLLLLHLGKQKT